MTTTSKGTAEVTLPADDQILITREFNAPRHLVYRAWTTPELVKQWWGSGRGNVTIAEIDLRVGGAWRYVMLAQGDFEVGFHGEFREIVENEKVVNTEIYEGAPGGEDNPTLITVTFEDLPGGRTLLRSLTETGSQEVRDMIIDSGMEAGVQDGMDLLEELAVSMAE